MRSQLIFCFLIVVEHALSKVTDVTSRQDLVATYFPFKGTIRFNVKTNRDATTILVGKLPLDINKDPYIEIGIGGSSSTVSWIRRKRWTDGNIKVETPGIVNENEFRGFWISMIPPATWVVGKENESLPFLFWTDPNPFTITHFGVATCCDDNWGEWKVLEDDSDNNDVCYKIGSCSSSSTSPTSLATLTNKKKKFVTYEYTSNWDEARAYCENKNLKLASIKNKEEQAKIEKAILDIQMPISGVWLAANDRAQYNQFMWHDGTNQVVDYNNWPNGRVPNHHTSGKNCVFASYVALVVQNTATWFVQNCNDKFHFFCEEYE